MQPTEQIDQTALTLSRAIRSAEGGDYNNVSGDGGTSAGAYQWNNFVGGKSTKLKKGELPSNFTNAAKQYGLDSADFSQTNQDHLAYLQLKAQLDAGHSQSEVASWWNSGGYEATGKKGYNAATSTSYDTPAYVNKVKKYYEQLNQQPTPPPPTDTFGQKALEVGKGVVKGAGSTAKMLIENVLQSGVNATIPGGQLLSATPQGQKQVQNLQSQVTTPLGLTDENLKSQNPYQTGGKVAETVGEMAVPGKWISEGLRLARAPEVAKWFASPALTKNAVMQGLSSIGENPQVVKDAQAILPMIKSKLLQWGDTASAVKNNSLALLKGIGNTSQSLIERLRGMDMPPTFQPEELNGVFKDVIKSIEANVPPPSQAAAKSTAEWLWGKLVSNLPKTGDIISADALEARQAFDKEIKGIDPNAFEHATRMGWNAALRGIRQGVNSLIDSKAPDQGVKDALAHQTSLYNVLENVGERGWQIVKKAEGLTQKTGLKGFAAKHPGLVNFGGEVLRQVPGLGVTGGLLHQILSQRGSQ